MEQNVKDDLNSSKFSMKYVSFFLQLTIVFLFAAGAFAIIVPDEKVHWIICLSLSFVMQVMAIIFRYRANSALKRALKEK